MKELENKIRQITRKVLNEDVQVKNKQDEQLRLIAQTITTLKTQLSELESQLPDDSSMAEIIYSTLGHIKAAQKAFLKVRNYIGKK